MNFFTNDSFAYAKELLGKTYCYKLDENPEKVVCAFTLAKGAFSVAKGAFTLTKPKHENRLPQSVQDLQSDLQE